MLLAALSIRVTVVAQDQAYVVKNGYRQSANKTQALLLTQSAPKDAKNSVERLPYNPIGLLRGLAFNVFGIVALRMLGPASLHIYK